MIDNMGEYIFLACIIIFAIGIIMYNKIMKNNNDECNDNKMNNELDTKYLNFKHIIDDLYYDAFTCIVYMRTNTDNFYNTYIPYYASNGKPFIYNVTTKQLEEIKDINQRNEK